MAVSFNGGTQQPLVFPTKNDHFGVFWGYHHLRKHHFLDENPCRFASSSWSPQDVGAMEVDGENVTPSSSGVGNHTVLAMGNNSDGQLGCGVFWKSLFGRF